MGNLFSPAGRDLILCLRNILRLRAAARAGTLLRVFSRMEDPRKGARYLGRWLGRLPPQAVVPVLASILDRAERREPGSETALEAILCGELREGWPPGLSRRVQSQARAEGNFDLAAMLLELPAMDERLQPQGRQLSRDLQKVPLGVRKAMARRQDIYLMEKLLADPDRSVVTNLLDNPRLTVQEVVKLAARTEAREDVLASIAAHPRWIPRYRVKVALVFNPATPTRISLGLLRLLMAQELRQLSCDSRVSGIVSRRAGEILREREKRGGTPLIVLDIPAASRRVPEEVLARLSLPRRELMEELLRRTEAFADELFELGHPLAAKVVFPWSMSVFDAGDAPGLFRSALSREERRRLAESYWRPHRLRLDALVRRAVKAYGRCLLVECRSYPSSRPPGAGGGEGHRPDVCIGSDPLRTPPPMASFAAGWFRRLGHAVSERGSCTGAAPAGGTAAPPPGLSTLTVGLRRGLYMDERTGLRGEMFEETGAAVRRFLAVLADRFEKGDF